MSARLVGRALTTKGLNATEKLILIGLADCTNTATGKCFPSVEWLAREVAEKSKRTVQRWLRSLEVSGHIRTEPRPGTSNYYTVFPTPDTGVGGIGVTPVSPRGDRALSPRGDSQVSPEPEGTKKEERTREETDVDNSVPHHYCRAASAFVDHPKVGCTKCGSDTTRQEIAK